MKKGPRRAPVQGKYSLAEFAPAGANDFNHFSCAASPYWKNTSHGAEAALGQNLGFEGESPERSVFSHEARIAGFM